MDKDIRKPVRCIGSAYNDWKTLPSEVQDVMGYALHLAQSGKKADYAKPLRGFRGATVLEILDSFDGNTWRGVYTVQFPNAVYVLHAFQKKSRKGISTPSTEINLIRKRLVMAKEHYETYKT